ncbi:MULTISPECIES: DUF6468 domain-containing protein [Thalassobaculum]|uniref:DUF6468 domain-containing protein n=1 Tax=Thalassobaculum litoreum DSM 18839 TaxID=1123362 RepID=A0A8G2BKN7_9PROT|nr:MULTISPECIES: DUF6468 domain-containing protein [Thalassobaculum]SDG27100.1 hypothetical protein SAMN05660686_03851 [Thalassobaculum litoreum DSM 18839]
MNLALILDVLLIILLLATIVYAMVLHRRLSMLRSEKEGLETFLEKMNQATMKADASLKGIRQSAEQAQALLNDPMVKAQALRDELLFLIERADGSAERLAGSASGKAREEPEPQAPARKPARRAAPAAAPQPEKGEDDGARSQAERDLMNALRNVR